MKIEYNEGCVSHGLLEVDGRNFYDLSSDEQKRIALHLIQNASEDTIYDLLRNICENQGEEVNSGHCDQCGDYYCTYLLEV